MQPIDLRHLGNERVIGSYLVETDEGLALHDCGPSTTVDALKAGLAERELELHDLRHLLLSHIHFDHAGATGVLVREHPGLQVHVSAIGAPHLIDPSRLESSARRLYGESFDTLWGELAPVPEENVHIVGDRVLGLECFPAPGHASHQVCYLDGDGTVYTGDAVGVRIAQMSFNVPGTDIRTTTRGFGVVFSDVDQANSASVMLSFGNGQFQTFFAPASPSGWR